LLSVSIVVYELDASLLKRLLRSLLVAFNEAHINTNSTTISVIDNGDNLSDLKSLVKSPALSGPAYRIISNEKNVGYGKAHNQVIEKEKSKYHLILNPDVILFPDSLKIGLNYLEGNPDTCAVSPQAYDEKGNRQYLCKTYPSLYKLLLRGFAPDWLKKCKQKGLHYYEMRDMVEANEAACVEIISGCFILCRTELLQKIRGFDPRYFLYFEDFALSIELGKLSKLVYLPEMRIKHFGGNSSRKGIKHIRMFAQSAFIFFNTYGWKIW